MGKKKMILVLDTETTNITKTDKVENGNNLVYNVGWSAVIPTTGEVIEEHSYIVAEIFFGEAERMKSAYYANKIPDYLKGISTKEYIVESYYSILAEIHRFCRLNDIVAICAHNARFDVDALNTTLAWISGYQIYALPDIEIWDSMKMASSIFLPRQSYKQFCLDNDYMTKHKIPRPRLTAEILYRFITNNNEFIEEHTALADVRIEREIIFACYRAHKKMNKVLYPA